MTLQEDNASSKSNSIASHHSVDSTAAVSVSSSVSLPVATNHDDQVPTFSRHRKVCVTPVPGHWSLGNEESKVLTFCHHRKVCVALVTGQLIRAVVKGYEFANLPPPKIKIIKTGSVR